MSPGEKVRSNNTGRLLAVLVAAACLAAACRNAVAAGYKLSETSTNATALSAAYIANADGPDAAYYNPAGMALNADRAAIRGDLTLVHLPSIRFRGTQFLPAPVNATFAADDNSAGENILIPTMHYVGPYRGAARFGLSVVSPGGLSKRWAGWGARSAEEFSLQIVELNPALGYRVADNLAVGGGARMVYSSGVVKSIVPGSVFRDLEGDSVDFGYNLALHYRPSDSLALAATYRSKVNMTLRGHTRLGSAGTILYDGGVRLAVPLPAALAVAAAFTISQDTSVEFVVERTYWSAYDQLDFEYPSAIDPGLAPLFDDPIAKNWKDSNTYRVGVTHRVNDQLTLLGGLALDRAPNPHQTVGFELPESDGKIVSMGARYRVSRQLEIDGAVFYTKRDNLKLTAAASDNGLSGEFSNGGALLLSVGAAYSFQ